MEGDPYTRNNFSVNHEQAIKISYNILEKGSFSSGCECTTLLASSDVGNV